jgi:hypothetical protein
VSQLGEKLNEFLLYNQVVGFESGSASNSNSTNTWVEPCELALKPTCGPALPQEQFLYGLRRARAVYVVALVPHRADKEIAYDNTLDSNVIPVYNSNFSYEFEFGLDPIKPESEYDSTNKPLSGRAASFGHHVYSC